MSFDKFVIYPANCFKTHERLNEYKAFFEPQLDDMAISRNIKMGIKEIAARIDLDPTGKSSSRSRYPCDKIDLKKSIQKFLYRFFSGLCILFEIPVVLEAGKNSLAGDRDDDQFDEVGKDKGSND